MTLKTMFRDSQRGVNTVKTLCVNALLLLRWRKKKGGGGISLFPWKQVHKQISLYHQYLLHPFCRKWTVVPQREISYLFFTLDKENHHWCIPSLFSFTFYKIPSSLSGYLVGGQLHPYKSQWLDKDTYSHPSKDHIVPLAARARQRKKSSDPIHVNP